MLAGVAQWGLAAVVMLLLNRRLAASGGPVSVEDER